MTCYFLALWCAICESWAKKFGASQNQKSYCAALPRSVIILNLLTLRPNKAQCGAFFEQLAQRQERASHERQVNCSNQLLLKRPNVSKLVCSRFTNPINVCPALNFCNSGQTRKIFMFKFIEILKQWPILQKFSSNLNTCLKYLQNVFKNYFESVLAGALISLLVGFVYGLTCPNNIFQYFVRACASLGLTCVNGHLVLFLGLIMVCLDGLILLCLTLFKHCKTSNTVHMILFMGNVCAMITAGLPLFWEANTDSSFAMFALFKNSPVFWIYGAFIGLSLTLGLIMLRPYVIKPNVVFVQALCIIVSDVPMFLAGFFGVLLSCS